ncbi:unnamed protein product [Dicrocoelium dendriticum]|nr:unnamed protein product [Dicrocoelium dendriticum]
MGQQNMLNDPTDNFRTRLLIFGRHCKVLLWKNVLLRRRKPLFLTIELLLPLLIPVVIIAVRTRDADKIVPNCFTQTVAMPSMGLLSYVRSMICNFNYSCQQIQPPPLTFKWNFTSLLRMTQSLMWLLDTHRLSSDPLGYAMAASTAVEDIEEIYAIVAGFFGNYSPLMTALQNSSDAKNLYSTEILDYIGNLSRIICGVPVMQNDIGMLVSLLKNRPHSSGEESQDEGMSKPNSTCATIKRFLLQPYIREYTERLRFFAFGTVYYYPSTPETEDIMQRSNVTHRMLQELSNLMEHYLHNTSQALKSLFYNDTIIQQWRSRLHFCESQLLSISDRLTRFCRSVLLLLNNRTSIISLLDKTDKWVSNTHRLLRCMNLQYRILPIRNQTEMQNVMELVRTLAFPPSILILFRRIPKGTHVPNGTATNYTVYEVVLRTGQFRIDSTDAFKVLDRRWSPAPRQNPASGDVRYLTSGFMDIQEEIGRAILSVVAGGTDKPENSVAPAEWDIGQEFRFIPIPCYVSREFVGRVAKILPQFMHFSWILMVMITTKYIIEEKETGLKEFTKVVGLSNLTHWCAWFVTLVVPASVEAIIITVLLKFGNIIPLSDWFMLTLLFLSYVSAVISFTFMCSTLFRRANFGAIVTGILYFILYLPSLLVLGNENSLHPGILTVVCLSFQVPFNLALYYFIRIETRGFGAMWIDFWETQYATDVFSIGKCIMMLWLDSLIHWFLAWYLEAVLPSNFGHRKPFYFILTKEFWCKVQHPSAADEVGVTSGLIDSCPKDIGPLCVEAPAKDQTVSVRLENVCKKYSRDKVPALNCLTLNFYSNQLTALLGHNGAGKSTLLSILTGMQRATSGIVQVANFDIHRHLRHAREHLGFCPQYNILYNDLTVTEHLQFYARLKGVPMMDVIKQIEDFVLILGFQDKRNCRAKHLSGGQKRKLSVAIAFIGKTSVVLLDEPTSGVDPFSRRAIWDLLIRFKKNRCIVFTTHHMDEAEMLGDRIALLSRGTLKCFASSLFLRLNLGKGYRLTLCRASQGEDQQERLVESLVAVIQRLLPGSRLAEVAGPEVVFQVPTICGLDGKLGEFLTLLDAEDSPTVLYNQISEFRISSYTLTDSTLEDIFLELVSDGGGEAIANKDALFSELENPFRLEIISAPLDDTGDTISSFPENKGGDQDISANSVSIFEVALDSPSCFVNSSRMLLLGQLHAMFAKRFNHVKRFKRGWLIEFLLPAFLLIMAILFMQSVTTPLDNPPLPLHPWWMIYRRPKTELITFYENNMYLSGDPVLSNTADKLARRIASAYERAMNDPNGWTGTRCMPRHAYHFEPSNLQTCNTTGEMNIWRPYRELKSFQMQTVRNSSTLCSCTCGSGQLKCPPSATQSIRPPMLRLQTGDTLLNLSSYNMTEYMVATGADFILRRFGGLSFIQNSADVASRTKWKELMRQTNPLLEWLGQMTASKDTSTIDPFWKHLANVVGSMLPAPYHLQIWFNNRGYTSAPGYLNLLQNMQLRMLLSENASHPFNPSHGIVFVNHPTKLPPRTSRALMTDRVSLFELTLVAFTLLALSFIPSSLVTFLVLETHTDAKHLQFVSGLNVYLYWFSAFLWDILSYTLSASLCVLVFVAFQRHSFIGSDTIVAFLLLTFLYGVAVLPMMYPFSFVLRNPSTALVVVTTFNLLLGSVTLMTTYLLEVLAGQYPKLKLLNTALQDLFHLLPQYCLSSGLYELSVRSVQLDDPFAMRILGSKLIALVVQSVGFFLVVLTIETNCFGASCVKKLVGKMKEKSRNIFAAELSRRGTIDDVEKEVMEEKRRVCELYQSGRLSAASTVGAINLTKIFRRHKVPAVNHLTFAVHTSECFGLLGLNGAGKTTTFRMLTGLTRPTWGSVFINGKDAADRQFNNFGFCPQFDALLESLTGRETLLLYARLHGITGSIIASYVDQILKDMGLGLHADKIIKSYSGGNRRKLSTAIAILGNPKVVFLDEPTSGVDPISKRLLWKQIRRLLDAGTSVVLTTHSMEECEALCNRLGIMVAERFGGGYTVDMRITPGTSVTEQIKDYLDRNFEPIGQEKAHEGFHSIQFSRNTKLSSIFRMLNVLRSKGLVSDYSVKQSTLDQVFVNFVRMHMERKLKTDEDDIFDGVIQQ